MPFNSSPSSRAPRGTSSHVTSSVENRPWRGKKGPGFFTRRCRSGNQHANNVLRSTAVARNDKKTGFGRKGVACQLVPRGARDDGKVLDGVDNSVTVAGLSVLAVRWSGPLPSPVILSLSKDNFGDGASSKLPYQQRVDQQNANEGYPSTSLRMTGKEACLQEDPFQSGAVPAITPHAGSGAYRLNQICVRKTYETVVSFSVSHVCEADRREALHRIPQCV